jgi:cytochrome c biogenesis protein CcmG, thiol:disulfide interchange protein DsbE
MEDAVTDAPGAVTGHRAQGDGQRGPSARIRLDRRWVVGGLCAAAVPVAWYAATRPIVPGGAPRAWSGGASKGVAPLVDHEAPGFALPGLGGTMVEMKRLRGPVLLNFWATWCVPCREELPLFEQAYRRHKDAGFVLLGVSIDSEVSAKDIPAYMKEGSPVVGAYSFPVALDTKQEVAWTYKLAGIPSTFFIDTDGVIRALRPGAVSSAVLEEGLTTILPGAA